MELLERKNAKEEWKLPKNVRQIGEPGSGMKIMMEDYVYTFLHQMAESNLTCIKTAALVGRVQEDYGIYIQGALEIDMGQEVKEWFSHEHWRNIFQEVQMWFEGMEVIGWYMANPGFPPVLTEELKRVHNRNFPGDSYVFFQTDVLDNEEVFYVRGETGLTPLCGYYIYYEKNDKMQAYMSKQRGGVGIEPEGIFKDRAAARFRNVMQEKKEQNSQRKVLAFLYTCCTFLVMVILVIGVTLVNNYDRMANMENAITQISESLGDTSPGLPEESTDHFMEEAALEENQQALAKGQAVTEQPTQEEEQPSDEPEASSPEEPEPDEEVQEAISQNVQQPEQYEVKKGDTILDICRAKYGTDDMVREICELNGLEDGNIIYVGEIILLP